MSLWTELKTRWRSLVHGAGDDRETAEEIAFHLEMETEKLRASGHSRPEADRLARLAFGRVAATQEDVREARGNGWIDDLGRDLRQAIRQLRRSPTFTVIATLTLALGIGANTAIFSLVDGVLLRPVPLADSERLVVVWENDRASGTTREPGSWPDFLDFKRRATTLAGLEAATGLEINLTPDNGEPARLSGMGITGGYFELVGLSPILGRGFTADEAIPGGPRVALIGEGIWRGRFGADPGIVGRQVRFNDEVVTIVGVMPHGADFGLDQINARAVNRSSYASRGEIEVWLPLQATEAQFPRETHPFLLVGRLAREGSVAAASTELAGIARDLERSFPRSNVDRGASAESFRAVVFGPIRPVLGLLVGAVALVLLVACVNVANLLLARGTARAREVAVRAALGADFGRLGRQFVTESVLLALIGSALGVGLAYGGLAGLLALAPADIPRVDDVRIDLRVLTATMVAALTVGVAFGLVPTMQARRLDVVRVIRGETRGSSAGGARGARRWLVIAEMALSVMLVIGATLLIRSFRSVLDVDPGFRPAGVLKAEYQLPAARYPRDFSKYPNWVEVQSLHAGLLERARRIPGVESAAIAAAHPLDPGFTNSFVVVGREAEARDWGEITVRTVTGGYFPTLGVAIRSGRPIEDVDAPNATPVAVINEAAAKRFFAGQDPLGQQIRFWGISRQIVGVAADEKVRGLTQPAPPAVYLSLQQAPSNSGVLFLRTAGEPEILAKEARAAVWAGDPQLAVSGVEPLAETLSDSVGERRFAMIVLGGFAAVAMALALIGVYGVLSYTTAQRTRELGIRAALGASGRAVAGLVLKGGVGMAAIGVVLGLIGAALLARLMATLLFETTPLDPITYLLVPSGVIGAAAFAVWIPARRASRVSPIEALKAE